MRRIVVRRVIGWVMLLFGVGGVNVGLEEWSLGTEYHRTAGALNLMAAVAFVVGGIRLAFGRPKRDRVKAQRDQDQQGPT